MPAVELTCEEISLLRLSLTMRSNWVETGNVVLSAVDAENQKMPVKPLSDFQRELLAGIHAVYKKLLKAGEDCGRAIKDYEHG